MVDNRFRPLEDRARACDALWRRAYDSGVRRDYEASPTTIKQTMLDILGRAAEKPLVKFYDEEISRRRADDRACRLANALDSLGIAKGDRVCLVVSNRPEILYGFMACYKSGYVATAFNQRSTAAEICDFIEAVRPSALMIEENNLPKVLGAMGEGRCLSLREVVVVGGTGGRGGFPGTRIHGFDDLMRHADPDEPAVEVAPDDPAILLFTGGTTGVPKGVCASHGQMAGEIEAMRHWVAPALSSDDPSVLICMPMTHIMGINYGVHWQLVNGGCCVIAEGARSGQIVAAFERYHPTMWAALPTLLHSLSLEDRFADCPYKDLELVIFGGSFISLETLKQLESATRACFAESYGMSESFGFVSANPVVSGGKLGSIGLPISGTDMLIVDVGDGFTPLEPGMRGEIIFRGPQVASAYWENDEETKRAIKGGWMYSGDIGYMDEDGFFYIVDRKKDMIVVSGFNVFPKDIDERLMSHPDILDACTVGVPDAHSGERPKSFVVLREGSELDEAAVIAYCKEELVAYKAPKYVEFVESIPKTRNQKQDRTLLRETERRKRNGMESGARIPKVRA